MAGSMVQHLQGVFQPWLCSPVLSSVHTHTRPYLLVSCVLDLPGSLLAHPEAQSFQFHRVLLLLLAFLLSYVFLNTEKNSNLVLCSQARKSMLGWGEEGGLPISFTAAALVSATLQRVICLN